jgi:hypothetical protein
VVVLVEGGGEPMKILWWGLVHLNLIGAALQVTKGGWELAALSILTVVILWRVRGAYGVEP